VTEKEIRRTGKVPIQCRFADIKSYVRSPVTQTYPPQFMS